MATSQRDRTAELYTKARIKGSHISPYECQLCQVKYPVTGLARDCEDRHDALSK